MGGKYFDAFAIKNLDLQGELNMVRPYSYSHDDTFSNYTHYNQPLADPLGSGFIEFIGTIRYQPVKNLFLSMKGMYYIKGVDTGNANYGNDIFKDYTTHTTEYGVKMINGPRSNCALLTMNVSYEIRPNVYIDMGFTHRRYIYETGVYPNTTTTYIYGGLRMNLARRDYTFF